MSITKPFLGLDAAGAFKNLRNSHGEDGSKLFAIVLTNGYSMKLMTYSPYHAVGNKGSRINRK